MFEGNLKVFNNVYESGYLVHEEKSDKFIEDFIKEKKSPTWEKYFGEPVKHFNTIVISDIHLGSNVTRTELLLDFLNNISFDRLIINGDVFDSINMQRLNRSHWKILGKLRKLTDRENHAEVIWIRGNHDGFSDLLTQLLGIKVFNEYTFDWNGKKVLTLHGDVFDVFTSKHPIISDIADYLYRLSIHVDPVRMRLSSWLKRNSKAFLRNIEIVRNRAILYAKKQKADIVICGHTHHAETIERDGITYFNSGSWTLNPATFIGFTDKMAKEVSVHIGDFK